TDVHTCALPITQSLHLGGVEHDPNLAVHAAGAADRRHALDREQPPRYFIVDEPAQLLHRHVVGLDREIADRAAAADFDLADARLEDSIGQVAAHLIDGVLDVVDRLIGIGADHELHAGVAAAFARGRRDFVHPGVRADRRFDLLGDLGLDLGRRGPGLTDGDIDRGEIDVRTVVHVHAAERDETRQRKADEQDDRDDRITDRPCGNVPEIHWLGAWAFPEPTTGLTRSPSLTNPPARAITRSLPLSPATTVIPWSVTSPVRTLRRSTRLS